MNIEHSLNKANAELLSDLRCSFQVDFVPVPINHCEAITKGRHTTIKYNPNLIDNESIAHELLHIWLRNFNYVVGNHLNLICYNHPKLKKIFTKFLCDYIENCFDHRKMYPKYIEMGYSPTKFIINGLEEKCSLSDIDELRIRSGNNYWAMEINKYIGYLISIYADHAENNYKDHLDRLSQKDHNLFKIVTRFWISWENFDIRKIDPIYNSDFELTEAFMNEMKDWSVNKKII